MSFTNTFILSYYDSNHITLNYSLSSEVNAHSVNGYLRKGSPVSGYSKNWSTRTNEKEIILLNKLKAFLILENGSIEDVKKTTSYLKKVLSMKIVKDFNVCDVIVFITNDKQLSSSKDYYSSSIPPALYSKLKQVGDYRKKDSKPVLIIDDQTIKNY